MKKVCGVFWIIMTALGGNTLREVLALPSESKNAFLFGMSKMKLAMCSGIILLSVFCLCGAVYSFLNKKNIFSSGKASGTGVYILSYTLTLGLIFLTPPVGKTALERALLERLTPLAYWAMAFILLAGPLLMVQNRERLWTYQTSSTGAPVWGIIIFVSMTGAVIFALFTGIGLDPISGTFYRQGVSLLEGHLILPLLVLYPLFGIFTGISERTPKGKFRKILPAAAAVLLWAGAVYFWQTTLFEGRSYFAPASRPPNFNFYPASDAENYDLLAQSLLLGNGFRNGLTVVRPLYAAFLALLHWIFGNNYMHLTNGQIMLLALIPVLVFLVGKHLRHPSAGLLAAVWVIWREIYSIRLTPFVQVSNSRLLMSDLPTMLIVLGVLFSAVHWTDGRHCSLKALICGGLIGVSMLLRTQCFVLIPAVWLIYIISGKNSPVKWRSVLLSALGLFLVFAPWTMWGKFHPNTTVNTEVSEGNYLLSLYRNAAGETDPDTGLADIIRNHPAETFRAVGSHFLNNEISSLLILPVRLLKPVETEQLFYEENLFWYRENARETIAKNTGLILVYITVITFGTVSVFRKAGFPGLAPLIFHLAYNLGNAFAMTSGFRFVLPVDWIILLYFAFGCTALLSFICRVTMIDGSNKPFEPVEERADSRLSPFIYAAVVLALLVTGAILPCCEALIPKRFEPKTEAEIAAEWKTLSPNAEYILRAYDEKDLVFLKGRAFYPRFYKANEGDSGGSSSAKRGLDSDRLVWMFHDSRVNVLSCPLDAAQVSAIGLSPVPDPMDIIAVGLQKEDYVEVLEMVPIMNDKEL